MQGLQNLTYVLLLVLFLSNGSSEGKVVVAPSWSECQTAKPLIVREYYSEGVNVGRKHFTVTDVEAICLKVEKHE